MDAVKTVNVHQAKSTLSALIAEVERGGVVRIARNGTPTVELVLVNAGTQRKPGLLSELPEWQGFDYNPTIFAPMTDAELAEEGWE